MSKDTVEASSYQIKGNSKSDAMYKAAGEAWAPPASKNSNQSQKTEAERLEQLILKGDTKAISGEMKKYDGHAGELAPIMDQAAQDLHKKGIELMYKHGGAMYSDDKSFRDQGVLSIVGSKGGKDVAFSTKTGEGTTIGGPIQFSKDHQYTDLEMAFSGDTKSQLKKIVHGKE